MHAEINITKVQSQRWKKSEKKEETHSGQHSKYIAKTEHSSIPEKKNTILEITDAQTMELSLTYYWICYVCAVRPLYGLSNSYQNVQKIYDL